MATQFTLGKNERLKSRKSIEKIFNEGKKMSLPPYRIFYSINISAEKSLLLFGVGVSSKNFKRAVDRNKIKRLTREAYRMQKQLLKEIITKKNFHLEVFFIYTGKELPVYNDIYKKVGAALRNIEKIAAV